LNYSVLVTVFIVDILCEYTTTLYGDTVFKTRWKNEASKYYV